MLKLLMMAVMLLAAVPAPAQKKIKKQAPPGTVKVNDSMYMDRQPVSNMDYFVFLQSVRTFWNHAFSDSINQLRDMKMDVSLVQLKLRYNHRWHSTQQHLLNRMRVEKQPYKFLDSTLSPMEYLRQPEIGNYPVLGVSIEQAVTYCKWRTDMVRILYARRNNTERRIERHYGFVEYELPRAAHWQTAYLEKGELGKILLNMPPPGEKNERDVFLAYPYPVTEWMHPEDTVLKYTVTPGGSVFNMTQPPKEAVNMQMGFRCGCRVK